MLPQKGSIMQYLLFLVCNFVLREDGQDLVEYALVVALIAFGAIAGMQLLAGGINEAFSGIATMLTDTIKKSPS